MNQKDNDSTEGIYEWLKSTLLNLNLVGGNMKPEELLKKTATPHTAMRLLLKPWKINPRGPF